MNGAKVAFTDLEMVLELCRSSNAAAFVDVGWQLSPGFAEVPGVSAGKGKSEGHCETQETGGKALCVSGFESFRRGLSSALANYRQSQSAMFLKPAR